MSYGRTLRTLSCPPGPIGQRSSTAGGCESTFHLCLGMPSKAFGQQPIIVHVRGHGITIALWTGAAYPVASGPLNFPGSSVLEPHEVIAGILWGSRSRVPL